MLAPELHPHRVSFVQQHVLGLALGRVVGFFGLEGDAIAVELEQIVDHGLVGKVVQERGETIVGPVQEEERSTLPSCGLLTFATTAVVPPRWIERHEFVHLQVEEIGKAGANGGRLTVPDVRVFVQCGTHGDEFLSNLQFDGCHALAQVKSCEGILQVKGERSFFFGQEIDVDFHEGLDPLQQRLALFDLVE